MVSILKLFYKLPDRNKKQSTSIDFFLTYITFESNLLYMKYLILTVCATLLLSCSPKAEKATVNSSDWSFPHFEKQDDVNPILKPDNELFFTDPITQNQVFWEERNVLNPAAIVRNDTVFMLYRAQDQWGTSRIGLAYSSDGIQFTKKTSPVFYPDQDVHKKEEWNYRKT